VKNYRLVEIYPADGQRYGRSTRDTIFSGPDKADLLKARDDYHKRPRKPWRETAYYYGSKRIYEYEL